MLISLLSLTDLEFEFDFVLKTHLFLQSLFASSNHFFGDICLYKNARSYFCLPNNQTKFSASKKS